ncbi:hypothetical protein WH47_04260 [Habropoda laboriosa]|uniref:Uncharacterized protein n=1 Tax=Habropoda laboriosa TaxID=597456 RepID=A0A0L7QVL9_9HYME|nr:hypothetical protein WH47_04260 [Habropoda laboriosa]
MVLKSIFQRTQSNVLPLLQNNLHNESRMQTQQLCMLILFVPLFLLLYCTKGYMEKWIIRICEKTYLIYVSINLKNTMYFLEKPFCILYCLFHNLLNTVFVWFD